MTTPKYALAHRLYTKGGIKVKVMRVLPSSNGGTHYYAVATLDDKHAFSTPEHELSPRHPRHGSQLISA